MEYRQKDRRQEICGFRTTADGARQMRINLRQPRRDSGPQECTSEQLRTAHLVRTILQKLGIPAGTGRPEHGRLPQHERFYWLDDLKKQNVARLLTFAVLALPFL